VRTRAVAPATTWHHDLVVYFVVSLCQDYANFCVKTMSFC
jgi:hypothetical protein